MTDAFEKLFNIMEIEGISGRNGVNARRQALREWIDDWVVEISFSQPVIKTKFNAEEEDFLKYYLGYQLGEGLMDECVEIDSTNNVLNAKVLGIKR